MKRAGIWLTVSGVVLMVISLTLGVVFAVNTLRPSHDFGGPVPVEGDGNSADILFAEGDEMALWVTGPRGHTPRSTPQCTVTGPAEVELDNSTRYTVTVTDETLSSFATFHIVEDGFYSVACDEGGVTVSPPVEVGRIFNGVAGVFVGVAGLILGFGLAVAGIIVWILANTRLNRARQPAPPR